VKSVPTFGNLSGDFSRNQSLPEGRASPQEYPDAHDPVQAEGSDSLAVIKDANR
jgi:hypothetical protein